MILKLRIHSSTEKNNKTTSKREFVQYTISRFLISRICKLLQTMLQKNNTLKLLKSSVNLCV